MVGRLTTQPSVYSFPINFQGYLINERLDHFFARYLPVGFNLAAKDRVDARCRTTIVDLIAFNNDDRCIVSKATHEYLP